MTVGSPFAERAVSLAMRAVLLLLLSALPLACSAPAPATAPASGATRVAIPSTALSEALAFLPSDTSYLTVTDWTALKAATGHKGVNSSSGNAERHQTYTDIYANQATASQFASDTIAFDLGSTVGSPPPNGASNQAQVWGFDALDLEWDASVFEPNARAGVMLLRLRPGIDLGMLVGRFDERGFGTETIAGDTVRDLGGQLYPTTLPDVESAMSNTAFLADRKTIAISTSLSELETYLEGLKTGVAPVITTAAAQLDDPWVVALLAGTPACGYFNPPAGWTLDPSFSAGLFVEIKGVGTLATFQAVAVGYSGNHSPGSRITFVYGDTSSPANDLGGRQLLAEQADRLAPDHHTYASSVFTVTGAEAVGTTLDIDVAPVNNAPIQLFEAFASRDLVPAVCGV